MHILTTTMRWTGEGQMPPEDIEKLKSRIAEAHLDGIRVRLWNAPDFSNAWMQLIKLQVDYLNTDHIDTLSQYLQTDHFKYISPVKMNH